MRSFKGKVAVNVVLHAEVQVDQAVECAAGLRGLGADHAMSALGKWYHR